MLAEISPLSGSKNGGQVLGYIEVNGCYTLFCHINDIIRINFKSEIPSPSGYMTGKGLTLTPSTEVSVYIRPSGKEELCFEINFNIYILTDHDLAFWGASYKNVLRHEISCHVYFVGKMVNRYLADIEKKWRKERLADEKKSLIDAKARFEDVCVHVEWLSIQIFDNDILDVLERAYRYWEDINNDWVPWQGDLFMTWALLGPWALAIPVI